MNTPNTQPQNLVETVLTKEDQDGLTPAIVKEMFREGNQRFASGAMTPRDRPAQVKCAIGSQFPKAIVLSCVDSRVPVEDVFDQGIGDTFVARVAGNFVNTDILGSMEFACKVAGAKLVVVLGHESCGAVKGAIDDVELGNLTSMLGKIKPAVQSFPDYAGDKTSANAEFVHKVSEKNVHLNVDNVRQQSPTLKEMEDNGEIAIIGAMYNLSTGLVDFFDD